MQDNGFSNPEAHGYGRDANCAASGDITNLLSILLQGPNIVPKAMHCQCKS